jgi:hypothetical protein
MLPDDYQEYEKLVKEIETLRHLKTAAEGVAALFEAKAHYAKQWAKRWKAAAKDNRMGLVDQIRRMR